VQLLALFAVPLLLQARSTLPRAAIRTAWAVLVLSVALQVLSTTMDPAVEVDQRAHGNPHSVIPNRVMNLVDVLSAREDGPRFAGIPGEWRTLTYLPFQLRLRFPRLANWAIAGWWLLVACIPVLVWAILNAATHAGPAQSPSP
jgi:hypothetical protein